MNAADYDEVMISLGLEPSTPTAGRARSKTSGRRTGRPPVDHGHGHYRTYAKGCRCQKCRKAHADKWARDLAERRQDPSAADRAGHGKTTTYTNYGCRCDACRAANTAAVNAYRARRRQHANQQRSAA